VQLGQGSEFIVALHQQGRMWSIDNEAIHLGFVSKLGGVLRKDRQLRMQRSYRYGRKGKQVHTQVSERRQQFVRFSGIVSYGR